MEGASSITISAGHVFRKGDLVSMEGRTYRVVDCETTTLTLKPVRPWLRVLFWTLVVVLAVVDIYLFFKEGT